MAKKELTSLSLLLNRDELSFVNIILSLNFWERLICNALEKIPESTPVNNSVWTFKMVIFIKYVQLIPIKQLFIKWIW